MDRRQQVLAFLQTQQFAVLASVNTAATVNAAFIGFGVNDQLELIFGTGNTTRKYANVTASPRVAFVIGGQEYVTVQYEGLASELSADSATAYKEAYFSKNPKARKHDGDEHERYFKVTPIWLRYSDYNQTPLAIFELQFREDGQLDERV